MFTTLVLLFSVFGLTVLLAGCLFLTQNMLQAERVKVPVNNNTNQNRDRRV